MRLQKPNIFQLDHDYYHKMKYEKDVSQKKNHLKRKVKKVETHISSVIIWIANELMLTDSLNQNTQPTFSKQY